jgi:hypothetical protein
MVKHVVFMKFKAGVGDTEIRDLERGLAALPPVIVEIQEYAFGRDVVRSDRSYDFALVSAFADLDALKRYQVHPNHQEVVKKVVALCDSILAVDFQY